MKNQNITMVIMDGYGISKIKKGNAIKAAHTPNIDKYIKEYPNTILNASGMDVGLPQGQIGNSEVGHMNIGAGRVLYQYLPRISRSIDEGSFFNNNAFLEVIDHCKDKNSNLHLMGLLSDGGVHSHIDHLFALLELAKKQGLKNVFIHCFLDGRDTSPKSGIVYLKKLIDKLNMIKVGKIATIIGRFYSMDRDNIWSRTEKAFNAMVYGEGLQFESAITAIKESYTNNITDEFLLPTVIVKGDIPIGTVKENDSIIFFNFRGDRARQITRPFVDSNFTLFKRKDSLSNVKFVCMTQYDLNMPNVKVAFKPTKIKNNLSEYLSYKGYKQLKIAETQKYAHVTFFFNGGIEKPYNREDRLLISSPKIKTFDEKPKMSAVEVTEEAIKRVNLRKYDFILINYANCDMVGHTGNFEATVKAVETVDNCIGKIVDAVKKQNGIVIITSDHGNAEQMIDYETGNIYTPHTTNVVPFILIDNNNKQSLNKGKLANIAPTILDIMGIEKPKEMTAETLLK